MKVKRNTLLLLACLVWSAAGFNILRIGLMAYPAHWSVVNVLLSVLVFGVFQRFIFGKLVNKHTARIHGYQEQRHFFLKFFDGKSFAIMAVMMSGGIGLRASGLAPERFIAVFYTGLGAALLLAGLLDTLCAHQKLRGAGFTVTVPADAAQAALLQDKGFAKAFALRCLPREVSRNLWSQAEFDTVTAKKLCELREQFWKDTVQLSPERMAVVLQELYARGATIVSNEHGYGIYFRKEDTLYFVEMMADSDRAAEILMEAAREKEVIVEKAVITVGAAQPLFLGEGTRQEYGMIRFDAEPFDVSESYLRLMLEN